MKQKTGEINREIIQNKEPNQQTNPPNQTKEQSTNQPDNKSNKAT
jgi:hypothetical protein